MLGLGEADLFATNVVNVAVGSDEGVTEDPGRAESATVHGEGSDDTLSVSELKIEDVFDLRDVVFLSTDGEDHIGKTGLGAGDGVDSVDVIVLGTGGLDHAVDVSLRGSEPGCAGVGDDLDLLGVVVGSHGECGDGELPVGEGAQGNVVGGSGAVLGVKSTIGDLTSISTGGEGGLTIEPDGEEGLVELGDGVLHGWDDIVNSKIWPAKTEDTIDWLVTEDVSDGFSKTEDLGFDFNASEVEGVAGEVSVAGSGTVLD